MGRLSPALVLVAGILGLCGCSSSDKSQTTEAAPSSTGDARSADAAAANLRASIPAIEAFYADHNTYAGVTDYHLRASYDVGLPSFTVVRAGAMSYCVESTVGDVTFQKAGPTADISPGVC